MIFNLDEEELEMKTGRYRREGQRIWKSICSVYVNEGIRNEGAK